MHLALVACDPGEHPWIHLEVGRCRRFIIIIVRAVVKIRDWDHCMFVFGVPSQGLIDQIQSLEVVEILFLTLDEAIATDLINV